MAAKWICDGCGKEQPADVGHGGHAFVKPNAWFERSDKNGIQTACSRECVKKVAEKTKTTDVILPGM